jgi:hypothetical protein
LSDQAATLEGEVTRSLREHMDTAPVLRMDDQVRSQFLMGASDFEEALANEIRVLAGYILALSGVVDALRTQVEGLEAAAELHPKVHEARENVHLANHHGIEIAPEST